MSDTLSISHTIAAGKRRKIDVLGRFVYCRTASQQEFEIKVGAGSPISFFPGSTWRPKDEFRSVTVVNKSSTDELTISLVIGPEDFELSQFRVAAANRIVPIQDVSVAAGAGAMVLAANLDRQRVIVQNLFGNVRELRVGDATVAVDVGTEIAPGEARELRTTAEIWIFNPDSAAMKVSITEFLE